MKTEMIPISEIAEVNPKTDLHGLTPDSFVSFIPMADVTENGQWTGRQERHLRDVRVGYTVFAEKDVLFAKITPCMENGKGAHPKGLKNGIGFGSTEFHVLRARNGNDPRFLFHWLQAKPTRSRAIAFMGGSAGQQRVQKDFFINYLVPNIEPSEQIRIAYVLDTIDAAIATTEAVIAKLKQVRAGMLQDLLSYGLDEHSQLRDPIAHPEQFKDSPLGRIPRDWDMKELNEFYAIPSRNGLYKKASCYGHGYRMIHMSQMFKRFFIDESEAVFVAVEPQELKRYSLQEGDLLFARRSLNLEGAGLCSMVGRLKEQVTFESSIVRVRLNQELCIPRFAVEFFRSPPGYLLRRRFIRQVAVSGVSSNDIGHFLLPCPKLAEQEQILALLYSHDKTISLYESEKDKLQYFKSGLQDDLLTGRVRVPETIMKGAVRK